MQEMTRITLEMYDNKYTFETECSDYTANELKEIFSRMLVQAGFSPSVIQLEDGGFYRCDYVDGAKSEEAQHGEE